MKSAGTPIPRRPSTSSSSRRISAALLQARRAGRGQLATHPADLPGKLPLPLRLQDRGHRRPLRGPRIHRRRRPVLLPKPPRVPELLLPAPLLRRCVRRGRWTRSSPRPTGGGVARGPNSSAVLPRLLGRAAARRGAHGRTVLQTFPGQTPAGKRAALRGPPGVHGPPRGVRAPGSRTGLPAAGPGRDRLPNHRPLERAARGRPAGVLAGPDPGRHHRSGLRYVLEDGRALPSAGLSIYRIPRQPARRDWRHS